MKLREDIRLYRLGNEYAVVDPGRNDERQSYVYPMNDAAALLWERFQGHEPDVEAMADVLCEEYDVPRDTAVRDIQELLRQWQEYGLLT